MAALHSALCPLELRMWFMAVDHVFNIPGRKQRYVFSPSQHWALHLTSTTIAARIVLFKVSGLTEILL